MNYNCSNLSYLRKLQEQVKKAFCYQKLFWPFTVWINCSSDREIFANSRPSASNFKKISRSLEQFFLTVGQNNFGNKIPMFARKNFCLDETNTYLLFYQPLEADNYLGNKRRNFVQLLYRNKWIYMLSISLVEKFI